MQILEECLKVRKFLDILDNYTPIYSCFIHVKEKNLSKQPFNLRNTYKKLSEFIVDRYTFSTLNFGYITTKIDLIVNSGVIYKINYPEIELFNHSFKFIKSESNNNILKEKVIIDNNFERYNQYNTINIMEIEDVRQQFNISCS